MIVSKNKSDIQKIPTKTGAGFIVANIFSFCLVLVIIDGFVRFKNKQEALAFYGVYHSNPVNQVIHFFGVPLILWSILIFLSYVPIPLLSGVCIKLPGLNLHPITYATLLAFIYIVAFIRIDLLGGLLYSPIVCSMYYSATNFQQSDYNKAAEASKKQMTKKNDEYVSRTTTISWAGTGKTMTFALLAHIFAWYIQIHPGHAIFEGAKPAVFASIGGALSAAPIFAFYEGLWVLGINKQLQDQTLDLVSKYTAELCASGTPMRVCESISI